MGRPYSARNCRVEITYQGDIVTLLANRVTVNATADRVDVANFESGVDALNNAFYGDFIAGVTIAEINIEAFEADEDDAAKNYIWALSLRAGCEVDKLQIYTDKEDGLRSWLFKPATLLDISTDAEVHGAVKHMLRLVNRGSWQYPL